MDVHFRLWVQAVVLLEALKGEDVQCITLRSLSLARNALPDVAMQELGGFLRSPVGRKLTELDLSCVGVGDEASYPRPNK